MRVTTYAAKRDEKKYGYAVMEYGKKEQFPELVNFSKDVGQAEARNNAYAWNLDIEKPPLLTTERVLKGKNCTFSHYFAILTRF